MDDPLSAEVTSLHPASLPRRAVHPMRDRSGVRGDPPTGEVPEPICRMILRAIATADVLALAFPRLQRSVVVDLRPVASDHPPVVLAPSLLTAAQALQVVATHRSALAGIECYAQATWGGSTQAFARQGLLPALLDRLSAEAGQEAMAVFEELEELERGQQRK